MGPGYRARAVRHHQHTPAANTPPLPGFLMQVTTTYWEMKAVSVNPIHIGYGLQHYGIYYKAKFRLLDRRDGSVLAYGHCDESPRPGARPSTKRRWRTEASC